MNWSELLTRLIVKLTSTKVIVAAAILVIVCFVELPGTNADVLKHLIYAIYGAKAVQYGAQMISEAKKGMPNGGN
ncbi:MAG: hypothetical protein AMJ65_01665 [Phycisphaerae bacterium SG8_4]|nr:MAG: hypothetical protein AMJ65_01665 [Phycisphaerae bacterium SG8_4]